MKLQFEKAKAEDLEAIVAIYNSTVPLRNVTADTSPVSVDSKRQWFSNHTENRPLIVVKSENKIIAWYNLHSFYGRPAYNSTVELGIYIHADFRGKGIGNLILEEVITHAKKLKLETLLGYIFANNNSSIRLFEKFGFKPWGHLPEVAEIDGKKIDLLILGKKI